MWRPWSWVKGAALRLRSKQAPRRWAFKALAAVGALMVMLWSYLDREISRELDAQINQRIESSQWSLHQFEVEFYRFAAVIQRLGSGMEAPHDLDVRYDILLSRFSVLKNDHWFILDTNKPLTERITALEQQVLKWEPLLAARSGRGGQDALALAVQQAEAQIKPLVADIHVTSSASKAQTRNHLVQNLEDINWAIAALALLAFGLVSSLYVQIKREEKARRSAETLAAEKSALVREVEEARNLAVAADKAKAAFLGAMSHEIRTPVSGIIGMADLLHKNAQAPDQGRWALAVKSSATALLTVVSDVLEFSRIEGAAVHLARDSVDIEEIVDSALELHALQAAEQGLWLESVIDADVPQHLTGDAGRIRQIVVNLVNNAVKFTQTGGVLVSVSARREADGRPSLCVAVEDTGPGIRQEDMHRLFRPFSQLDARASRRFGGTGLGLAICHGLASQMGGRVTVESPSGGGATFRLDLPLDEASVPQPPAHAPIDDLPAILVFMRSLPERAALASKLGKLGCTMGGPGAQPAPMDTDAQGVVVLDLDHPAASRIEQSIPSGWPVVRVVSATHQPVSGDTGTTLLKPVRRSALAAALLHASGRRDGAEAVTATPPSLRILVAEDTQLMADILAVYLRKDGHDVTVVVNGAEAVAALDRHTFDVVLMDVQMPVMDGITATKTIRSRAGAHARIPIVAVTANAHDDAAELCRIAGFNAFITKPVDKRTVANVIAAVTTKASVAVAGI